MRLPRTMTSRMGLLLAPGCRAGDVRRLRWGIRRIASVVRQRSGAWLMYLLAQQREDLQLLLVDLIKQIHFFRLVIVADVVFLRRAVLAHHDNGRRVRRLCRKQQV